ncbi:MAG: glycosyltransferase family 39 protein [Actinobacteria bacterium]|nr:glycosyltransferase family 39 protein [Actinomycetota bacterium]
MDWSAKPHKHRPLLSGPAIVLYLACVKLLVHMLTAGNYGFYRDELYFIAAGERLDLGYVDFPPLVAVASAIARSLFGDSLAALHFFPALASAGVVVLTGLMARELGGGRFAQVLAALASLVAPGILVFGTWLSMDAFDQLFWALAAYVLLLILKWDRPGLWLAFGLVAGLGLLAKVTMLFFGFAVFVALLLTPARKHLLSKWPWIGAVIAFAFLIPYAYWQIQNGWPTLEFWTNYGDKVDPDSVVEFLFEPVSVSFLLISGAIVAPVAVVPVLPVEALAKVTEPVGGNAGLESEAREAAEIPQPFAFREGWEDLAETVARVHRALPEEEREESCVLAGDFGEAGALDLFGPRYGLPQVISGHNNFYLWGPGGCTGEVVISVGVPLEKLQEVFGSVEQADTVECEYCMPKQDDLPVYVARDSKLPFEEAWPQFKQYN